MQLFFSLAAPAAGTRGRFTVPLQSHDPISGERLGIADLRLLAHVNGGPPTEWPPHHAHCEIQMAMTTVPGAAREVRSDVQGRRVTVSWKDPGNATHFQIGAASAPGLAPLYEQAVGDTSLVVDGVPPGTYYLRVRAINYVGRSAAVELPIVVR